MEERQLKLPEGGLRVDDPEVFARVWQRVMPQEELSPIRVGPAPAPPIQAPVQSPARPAAPPQVPVSAPRSVQASGQGCHDLGEASRQYLPALREMMEEAQSVWQGWRGLARRSPGSAARTLNTLAAGQQRGLHQLQAAYFLIAGSRYTPAGQRRPLSGSFSGALREMFAGEQHWRQTCLNAAQQVQDLCLRELCQDLAAEGEVHLGMIRRLLENNL